MQPNDHELYELCTDKEWDKVRKLLPKATRKQLFFRHAKLNSTVLHVVCRENAPLDIVNTLLTTGLDINAITTEGFSCLTDAIHHNVNIELVHLLLENGASVNHVFADTQNTLLHVAIKKNVKPGIVHLLLKYGADPNKCNFRGAGSLHSACQFKANTGLFKLLLEHGADVNKIDEHGVTPLHIAVHNNSAPTVVELLLESGANPNAREESGNTPLHIASQKGSQIEVVKVLFEFGAESLLNGDFLPSRPLGIAIYNDHKHLIPILTNPPLPTRIRLKQIMDLGVCAYCLKYSNGDSRLSTCKGCYSITYCDVKCAKADWVNHKPNCKRPVVTGPTQQFRDNIPFSHSVIIMLCSCVLYMCIRGYLF
jgi:ankyrin repeat protein